jgi:hypothetical protein
MCGIESIVCVVRSVFSVEQERWPLSGDEGFHRHCCYWLCYLKKLSDTSCSNQDVALVLWLKTSTDHGVSWGEIADRITVPSLCHSHPSCQQCIIWQGTDAKDTEDLHRCSVSTAVLFFLLLLWLWNGTSNPPPRFAHLGTRQGTAANFLTELF